MARRFMAGGGGRLEGEKVVEGDDGLDVSGVFVALEAGGGDEDGPYALAGPGLAAVDKRCRFGCQSELFD